MPSRGLIVEPYGPARQGAQQGPLRRMIVGGLNAELLAQARAVLDNRFEGFSVADGRVRLGFHPDNPVNLPAGRGVQMEDSHRGSGASARTASGRWPTPTIRSSSRSPRPWWSWPPGPLS